MEQRENQTAWIISGILLVLLIIVGFLYFSTKQSLDAVLENGKLNIAAERDQIAKDCHGAAADATACKQDLSDLASILSEFSVNIQEASTSVSASSTNR